MPLRNQGHGPIWVSPVTTLWTVRNIRHICAGMTQNTDILDAIGLLCPLPVLKARKRLKSLQSGAILELLADDPAAVIDVPHFCSEAGHTLVSHTDAGPHQVYLIRKGG